MLNEPYEWHSLLFRDQVIVILSGEYQADYRVVLQNRLLRVKSQDQMTTKVVEVPRDSQHLNSNDAFLILLDTPTIFLGTGSSQDEEAVAKKLANTVAASYTLVKQGTPQADALYQTLGGEPNLSPEDTQEGLVEPQLLVGGVSKNEFQLERLQVFTQLDLPQNDIAILDV